MRMIERSTAFKRDYKRIKKMPRYKNNLDSLISDILESLLIDKLLPEKYLDHSLSGNWYGQARVKISLGK